MYYIAGPMSGQKDHNYPAFQEATTTLRKKGMIIISPHELFPQPITALPVRVRQERLRKDMTQLARCDGIILLPGWSKSQGAKLELTVALELGLEVFCYCEGNGTVLDIS